MSRLRLTQLLAATIAAAVAVVCFLVIVPTTGPNTSPLAATVISNPDLPGLSSTPSFSGDLPVNELSNAAMVSAGASDPANTGAWSTQWYSSAVNSGNTLELQANIAPTAKLAESVAADAESSLLSKAAITDAKHTYAGSFSIAPLIGSGTAYVIPAINTKATSSTPANKSPAYPGKEIVFRVGRAVVVEDLSGKIASKANAIAVANREAAALALVVPKLPPFEVRHNPVGSSIVTIAVSVIVVIGFGLLPVGIEAGRRRRLAEVAARATRHRRVRGAKALKSRRRF